MILRMHRSLLFLATFLLCARLLAFNNEKSESLADFALKVWLNCRPCNSDYIITHVRFVNYVRNRGKAQVQVFITEMGTAAGGQRYTLLFLGQKHFLGMDDTLEYVSLPSETLDVIESGLSKTLSLGLVRYAERTPVWRYISIRVTKGDSTTAKKDNWNDWVFTVAASGHLNGQALTSENSWSGAISASRATQRSKTLLYVDAGYNESKYSTDGQNISAISSSKSFKAMDGLSLDSHWSVGGGLSGYSSTYANEKLDLTLFPEVEYDLFPNSESSLRQLRFRYQLNYEYSSYYAETVLDKTTDRLIGQSVAVILDLTQPWGTVNASLNGANYFYDFAKNHLQLYTQMSLPVVGGLSLSLSGAVSVIHDQLSLPLAGATADQILLQQTELATQYSYWTSFGLTYTFGSIYDDVVNSRLW